MKVAVTGETGVAREELVARAVAAGLNVMSSVSRFTSVELGGAAAVDLSASVTDVVALDGGDRRMERVAELELPVHEERWPEAPERGPVRAGPRVLPRGGAVDLPQSARWTVEASWVRHPSCEVDVVAFALDEGGQVSGDEDFVFYNAAETPDGAVRLVADGPAEQQVVVDLAALPEAVRNVTVAAAIDAGTGERTMLLAELYRRGDMWRLRVVGQGHEFGLAALARGFGVEIEE
ncbi:MAG TPA: TerD family protein [Spirillospora sp.]|nr:TerD family protein [Spirillospora sp.]